MIKFHVINDTNPQKFSKKLEEFCRNKSIYNIAYKTNTIQVQTNYSALIQYQ